MENKLKLKDIRAVISDIDGVLWRGATVMPGMVEFFQFLHQHSIPFTVATNNSAETPAQYYRRLVELGVPVELENVITCVVVTVAYLKRHFPAGAPLYVIGEESLRGAIREAGFELIDRADPAVQGVIVGCDYSLTYDKLKYAVLLLQRDLPFIGTNPDTLIPTEEGLVPEAGTTLVALEGVTGVAPLVMGKPFHFLYEMALERMGSRPQETVMLGDRLDTDVKGAQEAGLKTILVTTGVDNEETIPQKGIRPDAVFNTLETLHQAWQASL